MIIHWKDLAQSRKIYSIVDAQKNDLIKITTIHINVGTYLQY